MKAPRLVPATIVIAMASLTARAAEDPRASKLDAPNGNSLGSSFRSNLTAEAGTADSKATVSVVGGLSGGEPYYWLFRLSGSAPFDGKKADSVDIGTLSGLTAGSTASAEVSWLKWERATSSEIDAIDAVCQENIPKLIPGYDWKTISLYTPYTCNTDLLRKEALAEAAKTAGAAKAACEKASEDDKKTLPCSLLVGRQDPKLAVSIDSELKEVAKLAGDRVGKVLKPILRFTVGVKANRQEFKYVLPATPETLAKAGETGVGFSLAVSQVLQRSMWQLGYSREKSYKGADELDICTPIPSTLSTSCVKAGFGAPTKKSENILFAESRWSLGAGAFGLSPRVEYATKDSEWAISLPLYGLATAKKDLIGGVALGYTSKDKDFGAKVFVGKAFNML